MAGTRFLISTVILIELLILAAWSFCYGLCWKNDDILCHLLDPNNPTKSLNELTPPNWWDTTIEVHLVVEHVESKRDLTIWASLLQEWMEASKFQDWPYFGSLKIRMQVVPSRNWSSGPLTAKEVGPIWNNAIETDNAKNLKWIIYIPSHPLLTSNISDVTGGQRWSSWKRDADQLLTILVTDNVKNQNTFPDLKDDVGPWLDRATTLLSSQKDRIKYTDVDYLRQLQLTWHRSVIQDLDEWKFHLTTNEHHFILSSLGKYSVSFAERLQSIKQAHQVLEGVVSRNQKLLLEPEFPIEHYAAIFFPLLFPLLVPFMASVVKEIKRMKSKRGKKAENKSKSSQK